MNENEFWNLQRALGFEFSRYVLAHPEIEEEIPPDSFIVFQLDDNPEFNEWVQNIAKDQKDVGQPLLMVRIERLLPPVESRLVNPRIQEYQASM